MTVVGKSVAVRTQAYGRMPQSSTRAGRSGAGPRWRNGEEFERDLVNARVVELARTEDFSTGPADWALFFVVAGSRIAACHHYGCQPIQLERKPLQFRPERRPMFEQKTLTRPLSKGAKFMRMKIA